MYSRCQVQQLIERVKRSPDRPLRRVRSLLRKCRELRTLGASLMRGCAILGGDGDKRGVGRLEKTMAEIRRSITDLRVAAHEILSGTQRGTLSFDYAPNGAAYPAWAAEQQLKATMDTKSPEKRRNERL